MKHIMGQCWPIESEMAMTDGITMKGKGIKIHFVVKVYTTAVTQQTYGYSKYEAFCV